MRLLFHCFSLALLAATIYDASRCLKVHCGAHLPVMVITAALCIAWIEVLAFAPWRPSK